MERPVHCEDAMTGEMSALAAVLIILTFLALFVWSLFCLMAHTDGESDAARNDWANDHRGRLTRWSYLLGRRTGPRKSLNRARRAKLNEWKRSRS